METRMTIPEKPELPKVYVCHSTAWKYGHPPMVSYEAHRGYELHIPASRLEELEREVGRLKAEVEEWKEKWQDAKYEAMGEDL